MAEELCSDCPPKGYNASTRCMSCPRKGYVVGVTEFHRKDIAKAREKNPAAAREMSIYNMRALRGDFDTY